ncbi:MAG: hypothetical protein AAB391_01275 [Patescibacteria group bacterium]
MLSLTRPIHSSLVCYVDPKGDARTNAFIAEQLAQAVTTQECLDFTCCDIVGQPCRRNVWACPNWLVDELLANRIRLSLGFDLYVKDINSDDPPHFALSLEDGQKPEEALRAALDSMAIQLPSPFDLGEVPLKPSDFAILLPSTRARSQTPPSDSMRHSQPGVPPRYRRDRRKW